MSSGEVYMWEHYHNDQGDICRAYLIIHFASCATYSY